MDLGSSGTRRRSALVCVVVTALAASLLLGLAPVVGDRAVGRFDQALVWVSAAVTVVVAVDAARGLERARRGVPEGVRRSLLVVCGVALAAGVAASTTATRGTP